MESFGEYLNLMQYIYIYIYIDVRSTAADPFWEVARCYRDILTFLCHGAKIIALGGFPGGGGPGKPHQ